VAFRIRTAVLEVEVAVLEVEVAVLEVEVVAVLEVEVEVELAVLEVEVAGDRGNGSQRPGSGGERPELVDLACSNDAAAEEPECALRNGELGNWLCRTIVDPLTLDSDSWSTCGNATRALPSDACGCCDGDCPEECACGCPIEGVADAGVLVTMTRKSGEANEKCLAPEKAISLIAKPGDRVQCATECPVVEVP
jgi:hypothetical protein